MRSTQKPLSLSWNVTRSTVPASTSRSGTVAGSSAGMGSTIAYASGVWRVRRAQRLPSPVDDERMLLAPWLRTHLKAVTKRA
jgi:hypothetical protein